MHCIQWVAILILAIVASADALDTTRALRNTQVLSTLAKVAINRADPDPAKISNLTQEIVDLAKKAEEKAANDNDGAASDDTAAANDGGNNPHQAAAPDPAKTVNLTQEIANLATKALEAANETRNAAKAIQAKAIQDGQRTVVRASSPQASNPLGVKVPDSPANCAGDAGDCAAKAAEAAKLAKAAANDFMDHSTVADEMVKEVVNHVRTAKRLAETNMWQAEDASNAQTVATELSDAEKALEAKASGGEQEASQDDKFANKEYKEVDLNASTDEYVPSAVIMLSARHVATT